MRPFRFLAVLNTPTTTIATYTGAVAEAACDGASNLVARLRATSGNGLADVTQETDANANNSTLEVAQDLELGSGQNVALYQNDEDTTYALTYASRVGAQNVSAVYFAGDGTGITGAFDCVIFGTTQIAA